MTDNAVQRRPGGRTARNREQILRATTEVLLGEGYEQLSVARVAASAGVAESTVYRRWPTKARLVAEALAELARGANPIPDTGTLQGDLRTMLLQIVHLVERPEVQRIIRTVVGLDDANDEVAALKDEFWRTRFHGSAVIVERAVERGELAPGTDPYGVIEDLVAPTYFRVLVTGRPLDDAIVDRSVALVLQLWGPPPTS
jgi:AcrR family transcriptional regulator